MSWPLGPKAATVAAADITDVIVQGSRRASKIVIVTRGQPIPLTDTRTSENLRREVVAMKVFLGLG